ncbi:IS110 family transposase [Cohaesibacter celericrescens]|nr:IS110 family transposase [Cohaesibacter celericrescens]
MMTNDSIGIDISKDFLDAHRLSNGASARFPMTTAGFCSLSKWLGEEVLARVVFEATGPYHKNFERTFSGKFPLVKVNPLQARRFAQACGTRVKTDAVDARMLANFGNALRLEPDQPLDDKQHELKELFSSRGALIKDRTRLINRLQTQTLALVKRQTKARIDQITRQLKALQQDINAKVQGCPSRARANTILRSIPGIGEVAAATILIEMPEIGTLHKKGAASLTGLAPMTRQSGKWRGKATIQGGRKQLRNALYMPALVAARHNPDMCSKYKAMIEQGKPQKVALTAIMRKLIELANALVKADREWVQNGT